MTQLEDLVNNRHISWLHRLLTPAPRYRVRYHTNAPSFHATAELLAHESRPQTLAAIRRMANRHSVEAEAFDGERLVQTVRPTR